MAGITAMNNTVTNANILFFIIFLFVFIDTLGLTYFDLWPWHLKLPASRTKAVIVTNLLQSFEPSRSCYRQHEASKRLWLHC